MKTLLTPNSGFEFPSRNNNVRAEWAAIYVEPMIGSGERIAIGVAVANNSGFLVVPVVSLNRLSCLYGKESEAIIYASNLAIKYLNDALAAKGRDALYTWQQPIEGVTLGEVHISAGNSLEEIARTGLSACSSLVEKIAESDDMAPQGETVSTRRLEKLVKQRVIEKNASLEMAFVRKFQPNPDVRATTIGFVGHRIAANFGLIVPPNFSIQVKDAKSKLWDLAQIQEYVSNNEFNLSPELNRFELLVHRIKDNDPSYSDRQLEEVHRALKELEMEADRKEIRCRGLTSPEEIADLLLAAEAA